MTDDEIRDPATPSDPVPGVPAAPVSGESPVSPPDDDLDLGDLEATEPVEPPGPPQRPVRPGLRRSLVGLLVFVVAAATAAADRLAPAEPARLRTVEPLAPGGVLACPVFFGGNGRARLHLANFGAQPSKITVTTIPDAPGKPIFKTFTVEPGRAFTMPADGSLRQGASAVVEWAGGEVVASRVATFSAGEDRSGGVAAPCLRSGDRTLVVPSGSTLSAESSIVLLNPSTSDAVADVSLLAGGEETTPEGLKNVVVAARSRKILRAGDFAFDQRAVATVVRVRTGVLAADGILSSARGITVTPGVAPRTRLAGVGAGDGSTLLADVVALGEADSVTDASVLTPEGQGAFTTLPTDLEPASPQSVAPHDKRVPAVGVSVSLRDGSPLAGAMRWLVSLNGDRDDVAASMMVPPSRRLLAVTGDPATAQQSRVLLANPNPAPVVVRLRTITDKGAGPEIAAVTLEPGATASVPVGSIAGAFGVAADATEPIAMTISTTVVGRGDLVAFSVTGLPAVAARDVGVVGDPRIGVPAPR